MSLKDETWFCSKVKACGWSGPHSDTKPVKDTLGYVDTCPECGCDSFYVKNDGTVPKWWKPKKERIEKLKAELARLEATR